MIGGKARRGIVLAGALALAMSLGLGGVAQAKKAKTFSEKTTVNAGVPEDAATGPSIPLTSEIKVPKKFKKNVVGDVNVTGFQTAGSAAGAADDLIATLTAPGGRTIVLLSHIGDVSIGPLTMDDDTTTTICDDPTATPCLNNPAGTLTPPFAGTANLLANFSSMLGLPAGPLSDFDGVKMRGAWSLNVADTSGAATTSVLNQWGLRIKPAKPVSG